MQNSIQAVLLDIGDVLLEIDWQPSLEKFGIDLESFEKMREGELHDQFERGRLSVKDFFLGVKDELQLKGSLAEMQRGWGSAIKCEIPGVVDWILKYSSQFPFYVLSNTNQLHADEEFVKYALFDSFKELFMSHKMGLRKPEPEVFEAVLEEIGCPPESVLFVDDRPENIASARKIGICSEPCFRSAERLREIFEKHLGSH